MAVDAVASVVLQNLLHWLSEEPLMENQRVICDQLEKMKDGLKEIMDGANTERNEESKIWIRDCLVALYSVEDLTDSSALHITRRKKRLGFLMNHALFRKKFTACKMLGREVKRSKIELLKLNARKPKALGRATVNGNHALENSIPCDNGEKVEAESKQNSFSNRSPTSVFKEGDPLRNPRSFTVNGNHALENSIPSDNGEKAEAESKQNSFSNRSPTAVIIEGDPLRNPRSFTVNGNHALENSIPSDNGEKVGAESKQNSFSNRSPTAVIKEGDPLRNPRSFRMRRSGSSLTRHSYSNSEDVTKLRNSPTEIIKEGGDDPPLRRALSFRLLRRTEASLVRERFKQTMLTHNYSYNDEELSIIGYKHRVTKLRQRLETADDRIISIMGEPGSGKTMLARAIYGNKDIKSRFKHACAWVTIFKESQPKDILLNLLNQLKKSNGEEDPRTSDDVPKWINAYLMAKRHLIVLDGVQMDQWESLKDAFPDSSDGSRIIVITCDMGLGTSINPKVGPHVIDKLQPRESWALFLRKVGLKEEEEESHQDFGLDRGRIIKVCNELPLNIVLLGSLLSTKDRETWSEILDTHKDKDWETSDFVMLSYNDLDPHKKLCLLYMTMFPKDLDIPVRRLQRLWLAEGFVERAWGKSEEDVAQDYFQDLVKRSLIMVTKLCSDGSHRKCRLLEALHDHLLPNAHDLSLFNVHGGSGCNGEGGRSGTRRLIEFSDGNSCSLDPSQYQCLRSYISFNLQKKDTPALYVHDLVGKMIGKGYGLLRVLDLEGVYKPKLPENLGVLFHLRYLGLRWTFLDKIPKSVGELPYLETLDLKHTFINKIPESVWKLKHLRHLNLNEIHLDKDSRLHTRKSLPKLLTLWGLSVGQDCPIENGLTKFKDLRELGISLRFSKSSSSSETHGQVTKRLVDWISTLTDLQQLRLRSKDDFGNPADLQLTSFSGLGKLSHMKLLGKLQKLPEINQFPPHIKVLTLSVSRLCDDPMPILGQLPKLTVLRLLANSCMKDKMVCPAGSFKNLLDLKLWMLCNLEEWQVEKGAMEKLKELNIRCCRKLKNIPVELLQQKAFQDLVLNDMPDEVRKNADKINDGKHGKFSITVKDHGLRMEDYMSDEDLNGCMSIIPVNSRE